MSYSPLPPFHQIPLFSPHPGTFRHFPAISRNFLTFDESAGSGNIPASRRFRNPSHRASPQPTVSRCSETPSH